MLRWRRHRCANPNLQSVQPEALHHLSDNRIRQEIMQKSQARYAGRCICTYQSQDSNGRSCKGRHEVIKTRPAPLCYPAQVSDRSIRDWRTRHP